MSSHYSIYVLFLQEGARITRKMKKQNSQGSEFRACLYVGMTGLAVGERIKNHISGYKSCNLVKKYFTGEIFIDYPEYDTRFCYAEAVIKEREVADFLRHRGYSVYQN